jgi:hypothetical protein
MQYEGPRTPEEPSALRRNAICEGKMLLRNGSQCRATTTAASEGGTSLIQFVVLLALMGIVLTGAVAGVSKMLARERLDGWTRAITFDISAGRQAAETMRATVTVTLGTSSYLIAAGSARLKYGALPSDIVISTTCPASICSFDRRGVPTATGTITLTSSATGLSHVVTIQSGTGRVSYQ